MNSTVELKALASNGSIRAQEKLIDLYYFGIGIKKNSKEALKWARMAAANGSPHAE